MKKSAKRWATGALLAVAAGYVAGLLTAPKSGKETRQDIKDSANKSINEAERQLKHIHTELADMLGQAKALLNDRTGKARQELEAAIVVAQTAKEKAREILSAVHEGSSDDKDLKKAIAEANKAIAHLRIYLAK